jgi:hypothetical protein
MDIFQGINNMGCPLFLEKVHKAEFVMCIANYHAHSFIFESFIPERPKGLDISSFAAWNEVYYIML